MLRLAPHAVSWKCVELQQAQVYITQIVIFLKARKPVEPVSFVKKICQDVADGKTIARCNFVKRLTPIQTMDKASERGLENVARQVIAPHFHGPEQEGKKVSLQVLTYPSKTYIRNAPRFWEKLIS